VLEELGQLKKSTSLGLDPAAFWLVAKELSSETLWFKKKVNVGQFPKLSSRKIVIQQEQSP
jgi:hypothetical protein